MTNGGRDRYRIPHRVRHRFLGRKSEGRRRILHRNIWEDNVEHAYRLCYGISRTRSSYAKCVSTPIRTCVPVNAGVVIRSRRCSISIDRAKRFLMTVVRCGFFCCGLRETVAITAACSCPGNGQDRCPCKKISGVTSNSFLLMILFFYTGKFPTHFGKIKLLNLID